MCGIFGLIAGGNGRIPVEKLESLVLDLFRLSESRGKDASGVLCVDDGAVSVYKEPRRARLLLRTPRFGAVLERARESRLGGGRYVVAGHTRMVTNGSESDEGNNQPVVAGDAVVLHNGIIVNDEALWQALPGVERRHQVDTEVLAALLSGALARGEGMGAATRAALGQVRGANSFAFFHSATQAVALATSNGSLYFWRDPARELAVFGSERDILGKAVSRLLGGGAAEVRQLAASGVLVIPFDDEPFSVAPGEPRADDPRSGPSRRAIRVTPCDPGPQAARQPVRSASVAAVERRMVYDQAGIGALKRCSRCLLPETFPFISYDAEGVCHFCTSHKPRVLLGETALRGIADRARSRDGSQDCLVPISGGRDSSFGLHYAKKVLGLNPVAYTYDWGFVTDLARRNISRLCGALGVEHILVAADIRKKRENVRKNVSAWLARPQLSMIPLFMAGDKHFFYYASQVSRMMNLNAILFSMNWLERTGFKTGFAGVNDNSGQAKTYGLTPGSQLKLLWHYFSSFVSNPAYLNSSIPDTFFGFLSYYIQRKNYHSIFDYLDWDKDLIVDTIIDEYDWETSPDTTTTWRIGDGTAPFYNYIYTTVAGFSEHDTFRSNQIREGKIDRESALREVAEENRPRAESFKWYCDVIGVDALEALKVINAIPRLYRA